MSSSVRPHWQPALAADIAVPYMTVSGCGRGAQEAVQRTEAEARVGAGAGAEGCGGCAEATEGGRKGGAEGRAEHLQAVLHEGGIEERECAPPAATAQERSHRA